MINGETSQYSFTRHSSLITSLVLSYVISSRVRIARNLAGYPFPPEAADDERAAVVARVRRAVEQQAWFPTTAYLVMDELHPLDRRILEEKRLVSAEFVRPRSHRVVMIAGTRKFSLMLNEEDHIRIQAVQAGFSLFSAWQQADRLEHNLGASLEFAGSAQEGYLTTCSSNCGSGMRASVMLFLPALFAMKQIAPLLQHVQRNGYTVRGLYGEGSRSFGSQFQISRRITALRKDEQRQEMRRLYAVCDRLIAQERRARQHIVSSRGQRWMRKQIKQIRQTLDATEKIRFETAMTILSKYRLAVALRENPSRKADARLGQIDRLMMRIQPAHVHQYAGSSGRQHVAEDVVRAEILKKSQHIQV